MELLKITNLNKKYGEIIGTKDVSLSVSSGEIVGFVGPNGAGKSTTIRCSMGLIFPNSGKIEIFGKEANVDNMSKLNKDIGYIPAELGIYKKTTANEMLTFSAKLKGADEKEIEELSKIFELDTSKKISEMSLGNKRKVAICSAFLGSPKLYVFDEPTSGLDPIIQQRFFNILEQRVKKGAGVLLSTHILSDVQKHCSRAYVVKKGTIVAEESVLELRKKNLRVVEVLLSSPINIFEIKDSRTISQTEDRIVFEHYGNLTELMKELPKYPISNVFINPADLEQTVLHFYETEDKK